MLQFVPQTSIFSQNMSDGYISRQRDVKPRIGISLVKKKTAFKLAIRATFAIAKSLYLFQISQFSQKF